MNDNREKQIFRVTIIGSIVNLILTAAKIAAGIIGKSAAMISDGVHSLSDLVSDFVVLAFVKVSSKGRDKDHDFGHGKFETFATMIVGVLLIAVGGKLLADGVNGIVGFFRGEELETPGTIALWMAFISIISKELLARYTEAEGRRMDCAVVVANAWHHRSDALSSIGALFGIGGSILLGPRWAFLDPLASCVISIMLIVAAVKIALPAVRELLDVSLPDEDEDEIRRIAESVPGVIDLHEIKTIKEGPYIIIEAHLTVDPTISIVKAHDIATAVEDALRSKFGPETQISIHVEPEGEDS
ncbi:MAG: cation diffusion facilitator family transporter [Candidatus Cryptobacteroides sp.]